MVKRVGLMYHGPAGKPVIPDIKIFGINREPDAVIFTIEKIGQFEDEVVRVVLPEVSEIKVQGKSHDLAYIKLAEAGSAFEDNPVKPPFLLQ